MTRTRTTFEVVVGTFVSPVTIAAFPVRIIPTTLRRKSVYRLRVGADRNIAEIVQRLTEHDVELLEIRKCPQPPRERPVPRPRTPMPGEQPPTGGVVVPLAAATRGSRRRRSGGLLRGAAVLPFGR